MLYNIFRRPNFKTYIILISKKLQLYSASSRSFLQVLFIYLHPIA